LLQSIAVNEMMKTFQQQKSQSALHVVWLEKFTLLV